MTRSTILLTGLVVPAVFGNGRGDDPQTNKSTGRVVEGRVVDDHQSPIAGALVMLRPDTPPAFRVEGAARTDADGRYHITLTTVDLRDSRLQSMVLATGFASAMGTIEAGAGPTITNFTLKPETRKTTEVRLLDPSGKPAVAVELAGSVGVYIPWSTTKTDTEGRCRVAMAVGQPMVLMAKPAGARPIVTILMNAKNDPTAIAIRLLEPIRGRVNDAEGRPLPQITVGRSITFRLGKPMMVPHLQSSTATTDAEGRFELAPTVMIRPFQFERPDRKSPPMTICFADQEFRRFAYRVEDISGPIEPLEITLQPCRLIRAPIEPDPDFSSAGAVGSLSFMVVPRPANSTYPPELLSKQLSGEDMASGKPIEVRLPPGRYLLSLRRYITDVQKPGVAERELVVSPGEEPLDLPPLRIEPVAHQKNGRQAGSGDRGDRPRH